MRHRVILLVLLASCSTAHESIEDGGLDARSSDDGGIDSRVADAVAPSDAFVDRDVFVAVDALAPSDAAAPNDAYVDPSRPRPIAPLSTATVTSQTPTLRWALGSGSDGAHVDICRDRSLTLDCTSFAVTGTHGAPTAPLARGVWFWRLTATSSGSPLPYTSAIWELFVGARSAATDVSWGSTLDLDGDGYADVAIGAPGLDLGGGHVHVYLGGASGIGAVPDLSLSGPSDVYDFGAAVASAGDVNGDGFADLAVGEGGHQALLYFGGPSGLAASPSAVLTFPEDAGFGVAFANAGDVNGDGYADVALGVSRQIVHVFLGGPGGPEPSPSITLSCPDAGYSYFGASLASGDVNADGRPDLVVGPQRVDDYVGRVYVYLGTASGLPDTPDVTLFRPGIAAAFGQAVACAGDVDADGFADIAVGARDAGGRTYLYRGSASGLGATPDASLTPAMAAGYDELGVSSGAGDVNGDGYSDLVIDAYAGGTYNGGADVYLGGPTGVVTSALHLSCPERMDGSFCGAATVVGDLDGDGHADVVVGNYRAGYAYLYLAAPSGAIGPAPSSMLTTAAAPYDLFGLAIARIDDARGRRVRAHAIRGVLR